MSYDVLKGNDGKLAQDYMRGIVGIALGQTARFGVQTLAEQWGPGLFTNARMRDSLTRMNGAPQSYNPYRGNYAGFNPVSQKYHYNKGMSTTTTMNKKRSRSLWQSYYPTNRSDYRKKKFFRFNKYE